MKKPGTLRVRCYLWSMPISLPKMFRKVKKILLANSLGANSLGVPVARELSGLVALSQKIFRG